MKTTMLLSAILLSTVGSMAAACPFNPKAAYTEVTIPCIEFKNDYSQAFVNQRIDNGGECRVEAEAGSKLLVVGSNLVSVRGEEIQVLGYIKSPAFNCYQTNEGGDFYSTWQAVTLK